jgi:hypothetical protein
MGTLAEGCEEVKLYYCLTNLFESQVNDSFYVFKGFLEILDQFCELIELQRFGN